MKEKTRLLIIRWAAFLGGALCLVFGANLGSSRFCLGDQIFSALGLPVWSGGTQGLHYPGILGLIGAGICFYLFACTTKDKSKTMAYVILGAILAAALLNRLI